MGFNESIHQFQTDGDARTNTTNFNRRKKKTGFVQYFSIWYTHIGQLVKIHLNAELVEWWAAIGSIENGIDIGNTHFG